MADSSYEKGLTELSKMKVADLKIELKQRGLSTAGNKTELVERLQNAMNGDSTLSLDEPTEEISDEDAVLGDEEMAELSSNPDSQEVTENNKENPESNGGSIKKIILNRKPIVEEMKNEQKSETTEDKTKEKGKEEEDAVKESGETVTTKDDAGKKEEEKDGEKKGDCVSTATGDEVPKEKRIIKLSEIGVKERLEMRAKKFGVPLSDAAKKEARSARFNTNNQNDKSASSVKTPVDVTYEILKKRSERFGTTVSTALEKVELEARIAKRKARFGEVTPLKTAAQKKIKIVK